MIKQYAYNHGALHQNVRARNCFLLTLWLTTFGSLHSQLSKLGFGRRNDLSLQIILSLKILFCDGLLTQLIRSAWLNVRRRILSIWQASTGSPVASSMAKITSPEGSVQLVYAATMQCFVSHYMIACVFDARSNIIE